MFDIGWPEMLVIAIVLIVVVGPKDLPKMLRAFGKTTAGLRRMAGDFRRQFDEALREAELDDIRSTIDSARKLNPASDIRKALNPMEKAAADVRAGLDQMMRPQPAQSPTEPGSAVPAADAATAAQPAAAATPEAVPAAAPSPAEPPATGTEPAAPGTTGPGATTSGASS